MEKYEFEIVKKLGTLGTVSKTNWKKEINIVNWNNKGNRIDIRQWSPDHKKMGRGLTLYRNEFLTLKYILENTQIPKELIIEKETTIS